MILPTDTVYGLCASPWSWEPSEHLYELKGRDRRKPNALLAASVDVLLEQIPELPESLVRALLPGALTLILPNPARRFRWLTGSNQDSIGVRVPDLPAESRGILEAVSAVVATSANLAGGRDPRRIDEIPADILDGVAAIVDAGELPGTPSTVIDLTGDEPRMVREGAVTADEALARVRSAR